MNLQNNSHEIAAAAVFIGRQQPSSSRDAIPK